MTDSSHNDFLRTTTGIGITAAVFGVAVGFARWVIQQAPMAVQVLGQAALLAGMVIFTLAMGLYHTT